MATTTTNFGWDIPQSTDLVKDGATAIAALGQDIDTSMVDLKGGTTGQVLSKTSNTDMDFTWTSPTTGDITGVTAGTGISGGGTSGDVTITNSMATAIDAKGDLIAGTGADAFSRLAVGTNGQVLTADSTAATGLKWATAGASFSGVSASNKYPSGANQSISNNTDTAVLLDQEAFDTDSYHSTSTNTSRFTVPAGKAGKFLIAATASFDTNSTGIRELWTYVNGGNGKLLGKISASSAGATNLSGTVIYDLIVGDYVEMYVKQTSGGSLALLGGNVTYNTNLYMTYLGA